MKIKALLSPLPTLIALLFGVSVSWTQTDDYYGRIHESMESFGAVFREITTDYVDRTDPNAVVKSGIQGMLKDLDPYSVFLENDEEAESVERLSRGSYVGFGFSISERNGLLTITDVRPGFSAESAGVRIGDRLVSVNFQRVDTLDLDSLRQYTQGGKGTNALMRFVRPGKADTMTLNLVREEIPVVNVALKEVLNGTIAYVKLERFSRDAGRELRWSLDELKEENRIDAVILDLRGNPGGLLEAAVDVSEIFLPHNTMVVTTRDRMGRSREYRSDRQPLFETTPLVVLIDKYSASASEVVAGAIQDNDRGVIVGNRSFGKGLVQSVLPLPNDATLKLTTARYYTPSGRCIQKLHRPDPDQDSTGAFATRNGRVVRPSSGIYPDVELSEAPYQPLVEELLNSYAIGEFASMQASGMTSLPEAFKVDKGAMASFKSFVDSLEPRRRSALQGKLADLLKEMEANGSPKPALVSMRTALAAMKTEDRRSFDANVKVLGELLDAEIRSRFSTDAERLRRLLHSDPAVKAALDVLSSDRYNAVLGGDSSGDQ